MAYKLTIDGGVIRTDDGAAIPNAADNSDRKLYRAWLDAGNVPQAADVKLQVPGSVTPLQARKALRLAGLIDKVNAAVAASSPDVQEAWEYATVVERKDPIIGALAIQLGLTPDMLDDLFTTAARL